MSEKSEKIVKVFPVIQRAFMEALNAPGRISRLEELKAPEEIIEEERHGMLVAKTEVHMWLDELCV